MSFLSGDEFSLYCHLNLLTNVRQEEVKFIAEVKTNHVL